MPIYEYGCDKCWGEWEKVRSVEKMDDSQECPDCGEIGKMQRKEVNDCHFTFAGMGLPSMEGDGRWVEDFGGEGEVM